MGYALLRSDASGSLVTGTVQACDNDTLLVAGPAGLVRAERAEGCLLAPMHGDLVLVAMLDSEAWVLSVLKRRKAEAHLVLPESTRIEASSLTLASQKTTLESSELAMKGESLEIASEQANIQAGILTMTGSILVQGFASIQNFARRLGEIALRRKGNYGSVSETVQGLAERNAGRVREEARTSWQLRAENADVLAKEQVDIDASNIKVG